MGGVYARFCGVTFMAAGLLVLAANWLVRDFSTSIDGADIFLALIFSVSIGAVAFAVACLCLKSTFFSPLRMILAGFVGFGVAALLPFVSIVWPQAISLLLIGCSMSVMFGHLLEKKD